VSTGAPYPYIADASRRPVRQLNVATLMARAPGEPAWSVEELSDRVIEDLRVFFPCGDLRERPLGELWAAARDLVLTFERAPTVFVWVEERDRAQAVEEIAWSLLLEWGGLPALRGAVARELSAAMPRVVAAALVRLALPEAAARLLVRRFLQLALVEVREIHLPTDPQ
jgi:hypothetical protein